MRVQSFRSPFLSWSLLNQNWKSTRRADLCQAIKESFKTFLDPEIHRSLFLSSLSPAFCLSLPPLLPLSLFFSLLYHSPSLLSPSFFLSLLSSPLPLPLSPLPPSLLPSPSSPRIAPLSSSRPPPSLSWLPVAPQRDGDSGRFCVSAAKSLQASTNMTRGHADVTITVFHASCRADTRHHSWLKRHDDEQPHGTRTDIGSAAAWPQFWIKTR